MLLCELVSAQNGMFPPMNPMYPGMINPNWNPQIPQINDPNQNNIIRPPFYNDPRPSTISPPIRPPPMLFPPVTNQMCFNQMDGSIFPDSQECNRFVECQHGIVIRKACPDPLLFDLNIYFCVAASSVDCGTRRNAPTTVRPPILPPVSFPPSPDSVIHHSVSLLLLKLNFLSRFYQSKKSNM